MTQKKSRIEEMFGHPFTWGNWESTLIPIMTATLRRVKDGKLAAPVEVLFQSAVETFSYIIDSRRGSPKQWKSLNLTTRNGSSRTSIRLESRSTMAINWSYGKLTLSQNRFSKNTVLPLSSNRS